MTTLNSSPNSVVIFAGAGASKAVDASAYPTTVEFFERLPPAITDAPHFKHVVSFLRPNGGDRPLDIELVLWHLKELRDLCRVATESDNFSGWMINAGHINQASGLGTANIGHFIEIARHTNKHVENLIDSINQKVYDLYASRPNLDALKRTWIPLLKAFDNDRVRTEIITTNYDVVIERALREVRVADVGWEEEDFRTLNKVLWTDRRRSTGKGLLTKLHGSVTWSRGQDIIYIDGPIYKGTHDNHAIIYPGFKGRPQDPFFIALHEHFRRELRAARVAIFIGFAFRDPHINELIETSVTPETKCIVINPSRVDLPAAPWQVEYIEDGFGEAAVEQATAYVKRYLDAK